MVNNSSKPLLSSSTIPTVSSTNRRLHNSNFINSKRRHRDTTNSMPRSLLNNSSSIMAVMDNSNTAVSTNRMDNTAEGEEEVDISTIIEVEEEGVDIKGVVA